MGSTLLSVVLSFLALSNVAISQLENECGDMELSLQEQEEYRIAASSMPYVYESGDLYPRNALDFPPKAYLGFGLDMREASPLNIKAAVDAIKRPRRYVRLANDTKDYKLPGGGGVTWKLPVNTDPNDSEHNTYDDIKSFEDGSEAAERITNSDLVGGSYRCVKGDISVSASLKKQLDNKHAWSFYAYVFDVVSINYDEYVPAMNVKGLKCALRDLPKWNTGTIPDEDTIKRYRDLFATTGTHIITSVNFGSRLELTLEASNKDKETVKYFEADVKFALQGLPAHGSFDASVNGTEQYKDFQRTAESSCWVRGGNSTLGNIVKQNLASPDNYKNLVAWEATAQDNPDITSVTVTELWSMLSSSSDDDLRGYEISVQNAFGWLVQNPLTHYTVCSIVVSAPWAEIGLLTPKATFVDVEKIDPRDGVIFWTGSKINFMTPDGRVASDVRVTFRISNDGSPFGIEMAHGSAGYAGGQTGVTFIAEPTGVDPIFRYNNITRVGDPTNKEEFYGIPADQNGVVTGLYDETPTPDPTVDIKGGTAGLTGQGPGLPPPWPPEAGGLIRFMPETSLSSQLQGDNLVPGYGDVAVAKRRKSRREMAEE